MKTIALTIPVVFLFTTVFAQEQPENSPDEQIIVNKKYDDDGNLVEYDSTYIYQWSPDSTYNYFFPDNGSLPEDYMAEIDKMMKSFFSDSTFYGFRSAPFSSSPFNDDDFWGRMPGPDSLFSDRFLFEQDSLLNRFWGFRNGQFPPGRRMPDFDDIQKQLEEQLNSLRNSPDLIPEFQNEEQRNEWQELMERHQKELEAFRKRWEEEQQE